MVGSAFHDPSAGQVVLTEPLQDQLGFLFLREPINTQSFKTFFDFSIGEGTAADGLVFVISRVNPDDRGLT